MAWRSVEAESVHHDLPGNFRWIDHARMKQLPEPSTLPDRAGPSDDFGGERLRRGISWPANLLTLAALLGLAALLASLVGNLQSWALQRADILITLGGLACWRWSWFITQNLRAVAYRYFTFKKIRRQALEEEGRRGP